MKNMMNAPNLGLLATRQSSKTYSHAFCSRHIIEMKVCSHDRNTEIFPLWVLAPSDGHTRLVKDINRHVNIDEDFVGDLGRSTGKVFEFDAQGDSSLSPTTVFGFIYSILHSTEYRRKYGPHLLRSYPRIPSKPSASLFQALSSLGVDLVAFHLLEDDLPTASWNRIAPRHKSPLHNLVTKITGKGSSEVGKGYPKCAGGRVYINPSRWFDGVPEIVWNFHIGGYQVCEKWLKDRRGRTLSEEDILHYQRVVVALNETIRLMGEIDKVIEAHGGWPGAFITQKAGKAEG
jgi:predicted helicase